MSSIDLLSSIYYISMLLAGMCIRYVSHRRSDQIRIGFDGDIRICALCPERQKIRSRNFFSSSFFFFYLSISISLSFSSCSFLSHSRLLLLSLFSFNIALATLSLSSFQQYAGYNQSHRLANEIGIGVWFKNEDHATEVYHVFLTSETGASTSVRHSADNYLRTEPRKTSEVSSVYSRFWLSISRLTDVEYNTVIIHGGESEWHARDARCNRSADDRRWTETGHSENLLIQHLFRSWSDRKFSCSDWYWTQ